MEPTLLQIPFHLVRISTEQFAIIEDSYISTSEHKLSVQCRFSYDKENKMIACFAKFVFENGGSAFMLIETGCFFDIHPTFWTKSIQQGEDSIKIPRPLATHFLMLNVGTARGILHVKTEGTIFNSMLLPTVNVAEIITGDIDIQPTNL